MVKRIQPFGGIQLMATSFRRSIFLAFTLAVACIFTSAADFNARIKGTVTDPDGAVVANAAVTATNQATGVKFATTSLSDGGYSFPQLPIGTYSIEVTAPGFKSFSATGIVLNIDQEFVEPVKLSLGAASDTVSVVADSVQVDTTDMQFSNVVDSAQMTELPLIGRNFSNLELTLPGVQAASDRFGGFSVSGSQAQQSEFLINGADTNDIALNTLVLAPVLDAISQFNLIDGPLNAEYDRNSGGIVSASIKSGTNHVHGNAFEFYRDTFLNTNNYFQKHVDGSASPVSAFHQHIVGGTVGAPIWRNKLFVFGAFQASPQRVPQTTTSGVVNVYTTGNLGGDFSGDVYTGPAANAPPTAFSTNPIPSTVTIPGCTTGQTWVQCLGTGGLKGKVPTSAFNPVALALIKKYVPAPNDGATQYQFNETTASKSYQEDGRLDFNLNPQNQFSFIGLYDFYNSTNTLPFTGATVPGFSDGNNEHIQQYTFDYVRQFGPSAVNDFAAHWTRFNFKASFPQQIVDPASVGFNITPQDKSGQTVPQLAVDGFFTLGGTSNGPQPRVDSVYQIEDNFSKAWGRHALKFGYDSRRFNVSNLFDNSNSGVYAFNNSGSAYGTGDPSLDLLLGIPATYTQGTGSIIQADAFLNYVYAQDTWKLTNTVTLNYGLGYSVDTPLRNHQFNGLGVACFILGQQSKTFPGAPVDLSFPGDPGCTTSAAATTRHSEFGPRLGFSWAPDLGRISGGPGKFSVRGGFGIYYDRTEEESALQTLGTPPFGFTSSGAADFGGSPSLVNPFVDINGGLTTGTGGGAGTKSESNRFPYAEPAAGAPVSFAALEPIANISSFAPSFRAPYAENFQLSVERELPSKVIARVSYVASLARQNQIAFEGNYETAAGHAECVSDPACQAARNTQAIQYPQNKVANSKQVAEMGLVGSGSSSSYHSMQASITKNESHGLLFQLSYTYAHALDNGSSFENSGFGYNGQRGHNTSVPSRSTTATQLYDVPGNAWSSARCIPFPFRHGSKAILALQPGGFRLAGQRDCGRGDRLPV
jgi:hypothetical protein